MKKLLSIFFICTLFFSCSKDTAVLEDALESSTMSEANSKAKSKAKPNENNAFTEFKVTITNLGGTEEYVNILSPGTFVVQKKNSAPLFMVGVEAGEGLENLAEDGFPELLTMSLKNDPKVRSLGIFAIPVGDNAKGPIFPGDSYEFTITAKHNDFLNLATMFVQSNDLFISPDPEGIALFDSNKEPISGDITSHFKLWDAGTEVNAEPGVGEFQKPRQPAPNTGPTENGVVHLVDDGFTYPNVSTIMSVVISPIE
ncbi:spondin domain-containing protein [Gillisia hiemivivida]|jgi:hypothetical protein|uniref:Spondin domain-containing protein n=1 Tax=Gillisia hiemivivida TaxID=291190 RepID=A0A5C6ZQX7_9FLAO|nr:spondin domain-containing protein [Gillisia hiemivivida]TXD92755.1 hypothetical protein ES724_12555 [Gillisia hiemivivida]